MKNYFQMKFKYILPVGILILPSFSFADTFSPSLFGTIMTNPLSLADDIGEITRQGYWSYVVTWIVVALGIYLAMYIGLALILMLRTSFLKDKEKTNKINRLADEADQEFATISKRWNNSN